MEYVLLFLLPIPPLLLTFWRRERRYPVHAIDLGRVFAWVVFVYGWFPLLGLILAQHGFGGVQDSRVIDNMPSSEELSLVAGCFLTFLIGFSAIYSWNRRTLLPSRVEPASQLDIAVVIIGLALALFANHVLKFAFGVGDAGSYIESYTVARGLPDYIQQILGVLPQISFAFQLMAVTYILAWKRELYREAGIAVICMVLVSVFSGGSRASGFLLAIGYVICLSIYVRSITRTHVIAGAVVGLCLFILAGILRSDGELGGTIPMVQDGEFFSVFVNAIDMQRQLSDAEPGNIPLQFYFADLLRFVPQQLLGVEKLDPATWYVSTYYPEFYEQGGGLAFGTVTESVVGLGVVDALIRGTLLGWLFALISNRCMSSRIVPWRAAIYVWFVVMSYQALRDTTFSLLYRFAYYMLPALLFVWLFRQLRGTTSSLQSESPLE